MKSFSVTSEHFSLYEAFRKEAESKGWIFNESYIKDGFSEHSMHKYRCLHFSDKFLKYPFVWAFAFSNEEEGIPLETDWDKAVEMLDAIPKMTVDMPYYVTVTLSEIASWKKCDIEKIRIKL